MHHNNKQLRFTRRHELQWVESKLPAVTDRSSAVVRPLLVARSDADALALLPDSGNPASVFHIPHPVAAIKSGLETLTDKVPVPRRHASAGVGQQGIAEVVQVGPDVTGLEPGQLVVLTPYGGPASSAVGNLSSFASTPGWLTDLVLVANATSKLLALPAELDPFQMVAAGGDLQAAWNALEPQRQYITDRDVLVIGGDARCAALYAVALAKSLGAARIDYADHSAERLAIAKNLGAEVAEVNLQRRKPGHSGSYNLVICGSSERNMAGNALAALVPGGVFVQLPPFKLEGVRIPLSLLYDRRLRVAMSAEPANARLQGLFAYLLKHPLDLTSVLTHQAEFEEAPQHLFKDTTTVVLYRAALHSKRKFIP